MEQFEVVLKTPEGMHYTLSPVENGETILRLVSNIQFFTKITAEDSEKVKNWLAKQKGTTEREKSFLTRVEEAVKAVDYEYWIANLEPSVTDGKIYYAEGDAVGLGFSNNKWTQMAKEYAPERGSRLSNLHELFIWYALRIVNGLWTLDYVVNDSSSAGNYSNSPGALRFLEKTGARKCGGFCDGQGNSYKIVTREGGYALVGSSYCSNGYDYPVAGVNYNCSPSDILRNSSGVLVLLK